MLIRERFKCVKRVRWNTFDKKKKKRLQDAMKKTSFFSFDDNRIFTQSSATFFPFFLFDHFLSLANHLAPNWLVKLFSRRVFPFLFPSLSSSQFRPKIKRFSISPYCERSDPTKREIALLLRNWEWRRWKRSPFTMKIASPFFSIVFDSEIFSSHLKILLEIIRKTSSSTS